MKCYKLSSKYFIVPFILLSILLLLLLLVNSVFSTILGCILIASVIFVIINGMNTCYKVNEKSIVIQSLIGCIKIDFFDVDYIIKANPNNKLVSYIRVSSTNKAIAIYPWVINYKELLSEVLTGVRIANPNASIDILVSQTVKSEGSNSSMV